MRIKSNIEKKQQVALPQKKKKSQFIAVWCRLKQNRMAMAGLVILCLICAMALSADLFFDYETMAIQQSGALKLKPPSAQHWLGTDELGRDVLARIVYGTRVSLPVSVATILLSCTLGGVLGAIAGYVGKTVDNVIMRVMDVFLAIPSVLFAIAIVAALGPNLLNMLIAITVSNIPPFARVVRASVLTIRNEEFTEAARAIGANDRRILFHHIIPNALAPVIVQATLSIAGSILAIASLSFIGLGIQPPTPEWGSMLSGGRQYIRSAWWVCTFPGIAIMLSILSLNMLGDGLRDALDPKLKN